jgi:hypothetical protein
MKISILIAALVASVYSTAVPIEARQAKCAATCEETYTLAYEVDVPYNLS